MSKRARSSSFNSGDFRIENKVHADVGKNMFLNENFADFHFLFDDDGESVCNRIPSHKAVLAAGSDVFAIMLNGEWMEENEVKIVDASANAFKEFLQFFYLRQVNISMENVCEVFYLADKYDVRECMTQCEADIAQQTASKDWCKLLDLAVQFELKILKNHCLDNICSNGATEILASDEFLGCSNESLRAILTVDAIDCEEIDLFNACINWAKHKCETKGKNPSDDAIIRKELGDCLHLIRFGAMESERISECISRNKELFTLAELRDIWFSKGADKSRIEIFKNFTPRYDLRSWDERRSFHCELSKNDSSRRQLSVTESTTFRISRSLLFGGISVIELADADLWGSNRKVEAKLFVYELSIPQSDSSKLETEVSQQTIRFDVNNTGNQLSVQMLKFEPCRLQGNRNYEIRIETKMGQRRAPLYSGTSIGAFQQKQFGVGVTMHTQSSCSNFISSLYFN